MSLYSRLDRLAADVEKLNRQVTAVANSPQSQRTSVEGGSIDFNDADGNLMAVVGGQDDGSNTIRHVDGPIPPIPSGLSAHVDGPIVQVSWDGTFESDVTHDWHYLEVLAVGPNDEQLTGTINDLSGGETSLAATAQGDWFITARSVSRAGKRSLDGDAGTASVQLVGLTGAIDAIQESANGKNTIYYSPTEPVAPDGGFSNGDLWFDTSEEGNNTASVWDGNGWVSMEDARLATIIAAQEALESDLQDVQTSVDGKNTITYDPALPPASYVGAVGDTWYRTSGNSMVGFWKWDGAAWVQQELSTTVIPQIDIGAGTFGSMDGSRLTAHSITSDRVIIGSGGNVVPWGQITAGATYSPHEPYAVTGSTAALTPADAAKGLPAHLTVTRTSAGSWASIMSFWATPGQKLPVDEGAEYVFTVRVYSADVPRARLSLFAYSHGGSSTANNSGVFASTTGTVLSENVVEISVRGTVPVGAGYCLPYLQSSAAGPVGVVSVDLRKAVGTTLIENGAITTDKLAVGSITAESGVIASLDLGTATVGELDGIRIMGQTIRGEQLSGDAIDGKVITGATIQSGRDGQRWVGDTTGIRIFNADNEVRTKLSPDDSVFKGEVEADTLIVNGGSELRSTENKLGQGAKLTLEAGVTDPTAPPVVQTFWDTTDVPVASNETCYGLAWADNKYWTYVDLPAFGSPDSSIDRVVSIDPTTGALGDDIPMTDGFWAEGGIAAIGSELFLLGRKTGVNYKYFVRVYSTAGVFLREWEYAEAGWSSSNPLGFKPCIGASSTRIYIAHCDDEGQLIWRTYDKTTGARLGTVNTGYPTSSDLLGAYIGEGDWGVGDRIAIVKKSTRQVIVLTTAGANEASLHWNTPPNATGIVYQGGKFRTLDPNGSITNYESPGMGDNTSDWWATYRWSVDEDDDGINDYTSRIGPVKRFYWDRRARVRFMGAPLPVGVGYITPSIAKKTTTPTRTDFRTPSFSVYVGESTAWLSSLPSGWQSGPAPGDSNDFPDAEPSTIASASSTFEVRGDGSGRWGPLTFNADGTMSSSQVPTWIPITSFSPIPSDEGGGTYGPQSWGDVPSYRIWPDGKVEWRGVIAGAVSGGSTASRPLFTIPAEARPGRPKNKATAASGSTPVRVEFGPNADPTKFYAYPSGGARSWVSIDELFYYLP